MSNAENKKSKRIFLFLRIAFVVAGVILATWWASQVDPSTQQARWRTLTTINPALFSVALGIFILGQIVVGLRWWILLRSQTIRIPLWAAVKLHFLGLFYNNCMPGAVGGDLIRAWYVTKHTEKKFEAALSVFVDRAIGLLSTLVIAVFFYIVFLQGQKLSIFSRKQGGLLSSIVRYKIYLLSGLLIAVLVLVGLLMHRQIRGRLKKAWSNLVATAIRMALKFKSAVLIYCSRPLTMLGAFALTIVMQLTTITGFWLVGRNLGIEVSVKYYYVFFTLTWVLGAIPVSIGGAVVVEGMLIVLFKEFAGVPAGPAFALALCQRFVWVLASLPGGLIHISGTHLPKDFSIDSDTGVD